MHKTERVMLRTEFTMAIPQCDQTNETLPN